MLTDGRVRPEGRTMLLDNRVNRQRYDVLILPGGKVFSAEALGRVREFYERGGRVIATSCLPERSAEFGMDDALRSEVEALFGSPSERRAGTVRRNGAGGAAVFAPEPDARVAGAGLCRFGGRSGCRDRPIRCGIASSGTSFGYLTKMVASGQEASASDPTGGKSEPLSAISTSRKTGGIFTSLRTRRTIRSRRSGFAARQAEAAAVGPVHGRDDRARLAQGAPQRRNLYAFRARSASRVGRFRRGRAPRIRSGSHPAGIPVQASARRIALRRTGCRRPGRRPSVRSGVFRNCGRTVPNFRLLNALRGRNPNYLRKLCCD